EIFFGRFGPKDYFARLVEVNTLVVSVSFPAALAAFCEEARQSYALGLDVAVHSLSRTILEVALNDIVTRLARKPRNPGKSEKRQPTVKQRGLSVPGERGDEVYGPYRRLCAIIHGVSLGSEQGAP